MWKTHKTKECVKNVKISLENLRTRSSKPLIIAALQCYCRDNGDKI